MASELGKAYVQIVPSAEGISGSISSVIEPEAAQVGKSAGASIAGGIGSALKNAASVVAVGAAAMTGAIVKGVSDVAAYGDNIDKMSQKMGLSAQAYQEWDAVMQHSGTTIDVMQRGMTTLSKAAENGAEAFQAIGISQEEVASLSQEDLFAKTIEGLQNMESGTERTVLAQKLLGGSAKELGALLNTSAEDTQAMRDRVRELGGVMSDDAVKAAAAFQDNLQDMKTAVAGLGRGMMSDLLPSMTEIIGGFTSLIAGEEGAEEKLSSGFSSLFSNLDGIVNGFVDTVKNLMPSIISGITTMLPELITMATQLIVSLAQAIVSVLPELITTVIPALAEAAIQIIVALGQALLEAAPQLLDAGVQLFEMLGQSFRDSNMLDTGAQVIQGILDGITSAMPGLLSTGVGIITNVANGIFSAIPGLITTAGSIVGQLASFIAQNAPTILSSGADLLLNLVNGLIDNLPEIVNAAVDIVMQLVATLAANYPAIIQAGFETLIKLVEGLISAIPDLIVAILDICANIVENFMSYDWISLGKDIIQGIIDGIISLGDALITAILDMCTNAFDAVKKFFGISSPSKLMSDEVGRYIPEGIAQGIEEYSGVVTDAMDDLNADVLDAATVMDLTTTSNFVPNNSSETAIIARMDAILTILAKYFPEIAEQQRQFAESGVSITSIDRSLGVMLS